MLLQAALSRKQIGLDFNAPRSPIIEWRAALLPFVRLKQSRVTSLPVTTARLLLSTHILSEYQGYITLDHVVSQTIINVGSLQLGATCRNLLVVRRVGLAMYNMCNIVQHILAREDRTECRYITLLPGAQPLRNDAAQSAADAAVTATVHWLLPAQYYSCCPSSRRCRRLMMASAAVPRPPPRSDPVSSIAVAAAAASTAVDSRRRL
jgi:hypothetical protein